MSEKDEQGLHVVEEEVGDGLWVARELGNVDGLHEHADELRHLEHGEVLPPPQVLAALLSILADDGREEVVRIHHNVDEGVEEARVVGVASGSAVGNHPPYEGNRDVMVNMKEGNLSCIPLQKHDKRIEKLVPLGHVEHIYHVPHRHFLDFVRVSPKPIAICPRQKSSSERHVTAERNQHQVVRLNKNLKPKLFGSVSSCHFTIDRHTSQDD
mmetsp:Transcript_19881/g.47373  ORF Transcript_19881/g.47373 Transcript_19881/m.47373 type:complete len:212 (-) Transcript_19881:249-884(-)